MAKRGRGARFDECQQATSEKIWDGDTSGGGLEVSFGFRGSVPRILGTAGEYNFLAEWSFA